MTWLEPIRGKHPPLEHLVEKLRKQMRPKPGKNPEKALREIERQRAERIQRSERLRLEACALLMLANEIKGV